MFSIPVVNIKFRTPKNQNQNQFGMGVKNNSAYSLTNFQKGFESMSDLEQGDVNTPMTSQLSFSSEPIQKITRFDQAIFAVSQPADNRTEKDGI